MRRTAKPDAATFDPELSDLPQDLRWREFMGRAEALIFASGAPVPREALAAIVGQDCRLDELIADIQDELRLRPYELVFVAGGWQHRTRTRFAGAIRTQAERETAKTGLTRTGSLVATAIAYLQPVTRAELSRLTGKEISRDIIASLKRSGLIGAGPRAPEPGAPLTYVTTRLFLQIFGFASLRDLPDLAQMQENGPGLVPDAVMTQPEARFGAELDSIPGLTEEEELDE